MIGTRECNIQLEKAVRASPSPQCKQMTMAAKGGGLGYKTELMPTGPIMSIRRRLGIKPVKAITAVSMILLVMRLRSFYCNKDCLRYNKTSHYSNT